MDIVSTIITAVITAFVTLSGTILFFKQKKQVAILEVNEKEVNIADKEIDLTRKNIEALNDTMDVFLRSSKMKEEQIQKLEEFVHELKKELNKCKTQILEQERKINGMQARQTESVAVIERLKSGKAYSDGLICTNVGCDIREPKIGTYKTKEQ